jgi:hypothetical protein
MNDEHDAEETKRRMQKVLQGAFSGPPTPLKDIPTREGESRRTRRPKAAPASSSGAKRGSKLKKDRA